jgi:hypothetical protein
VYSFLCPTVVGMAPLSHPCARQVSRDEDDDDGDDIHVTEIKLTPGGSSTEHIYTQTTHKIRRTEHT